MIWMSNEMLPTSGHAGKDACHTFKGTLRESRAFHINLRLINDGFFPGCLVSAAMPSWWRPSTALGEGSAQLSGSVQRTQAQETGCVLGRLPSFCKVSTHEQTMFFHVYGQFRVCSAP
ncbi:unnamed protein product [Tetraodon nigroviridis]|uniref:(spotted green pufferfish) hypothetical protein n=1 Tax=Tetraodon nigroviridis TaxID=99883 RepID=Q4SHV7_TETNG|nr:unnamed protein product [Tetraodon nigroviridis]